MNKRDRLARRDRIDKLTREVEDRVPAFTREDVELLRETLPADVLHLGYQYEEEPQAYLHDLADRIEATLPPEVTTFTNCKFSSTGGGAVAGDSARDVEFTDCVELLLPPEDA